MQNTIEKRDGYGVANEWLTSDEAALYLKIERRTLLQWVRQAKGTRLHTLWHTTPRLEIQNLRLGCYAERARRALD